MNQAAIERAIPRIGIDVYSLRSQKWDAFRILDYCSNLGAKVVHFSEARFLGSLDPTHLLAVRRKAEELHLDIEIGMLSFCPTSNLFRPADGSPVEQLSRTMQAAQIIGSPIVRAVVGNAVDRRSSTPFIHTLRTAVEILRQVRPAALDCGIKIAVENHSGDMQSPQLRMLIEEAGPDFVGACLDSGNPLITLEDPHVALETLAPYVLTSHIRDTAVWLTEGGAAAAWVRMGEGNVEIDSYVRRYADLCPGRALSLEIIISPQPRPFPFRDPHFWGAYRDISAWQFQRFLQIAETGRPAVFRPLLSSETALDRERADLEQGIRYIKRLLTGDEFPTRYDA